MWNKIKEFLSLMLEVGEDIVMSEVYASTEYRLRKLEDQHVEDAYKLIDSWPSWKKNIAHITIKKSTDEENLK